jgi:hypothetical protein
VSESLPPSMQRDIDAIEWTEAEFRRRHGAEAASRWQQLGAGGEEELGATQLALIELRGPEPKLREALAWEIALRIDLLQDARASGRSTRDDDATTDSETRNQ